MDDPQACRILCDVEVQDVPTIATDEEKAIEQAEGDRRDSEEVHRGNRFSVIAEEGKPVLGRLREALCKQADFVVVDRNVLTIPVEELGDTKILWTILGGKTIFESKP